MDTKLDETPGLHMVLRNPRQMCRVHLLGIELLKMTNLMPKIPKPKASRLMQRYNPRRGKAKVFHPRAIKLFVNVKQWVLAANMHNSEKRISIGKSMK